MSSSSHGQPDKSDSQISLPLADGSATARPRVCASNSGNPYARIDELEANQTQPYDAEHLDLVRPLASERRGSSDGTLTHDPQQSLPLEEDPGTDKRPGWASTPSHPYARIDELEINQAQPYDSEETRAATPTAHERNNSIQGTSKRDFQAGCRRVFSGYMPHGLRGRLRQEYRDFIARNEQRSPIERTHILDELQRYDLRSTPGVRPHFNREDDLSLTKKLNSIEEAALRNSED